MIGAIYAEGLFEKALLEPARSGATDLYVVSGYASPAMVVRHFEELRRIGAVVNLDLQIGMTSKDGLPRPALVGFRNLRAQILSGKVQCRFNTGVPFHSKLYVWCSEDGPQRAFLGSANYSQTAFGIGSDVVRQMEVLTEVNPSDAFDYVINVSGTSVTAEDPKLESLLQIPSSYGGEWDSFASGSEEPSAEQEPPGASVLLPLVQTTKSPGEVHNAGAGLNWGQRGNRNRSEAYIPVPSSVGKAGFFPDRGVRFQLFTDTGDSFVATVAQAGGKAIETPENNGLIGEYFRRKLGLVPGDFVRTDDLTQFGSNAVKLIKIDDELFHMQFVPGLRYGK